MAVHYENKAGIAIITIDNPPVNVIGVDSRTAIDAAITRALNEEAKRLVITGAGRSFVAGADAKEFGRPSLPPHLNEILKRLASLSILTVAAINGTALGGGVEIALACRYRVAAPGASLGLPEVNLGIVPGSGGTQRLPRLVGAAIAYDLIGQGRAIKAEEALSIGLIDRIVDDPLGLAIALDDTVIMANVPIDQRPSLEAAPEAEAEALKRAKQRQKGQIAPIKAIGLVSLATTSAIDDGLAEERKIFLELRASPQAAALRHVFFAEREAQSRGRRYPQPKSEIASAVVVGGGNMGAGITYALAAAGLEVTNVEMSAEAQTRAQQNVERLVEQGASRGLLSLAARDAILTRLHYTTGYEAIPQADLAIEAVFEDMNVKHQVFASLEKAMPANAILATNTSYLDVNAIAERLADPSRFLGLHFFSPAHIMKLLEIVRGDKASADTLGKAYALATRLNKMPILAGVCDGFIGNRILTRYRSASDLLLLEGALPGDVDAAMQAFGMAMGPYATQDMSGLDIAYANRKRQNLRERTDIRYVPIADRLVEDHKRLGLKSGSGWYDYDEVKKPLASGVVAACIRQASAEAGIERKTFSPDQIAERILLAMISEACDILDENIAEKPSDIDLVLIHGYGFPRWLGGPMHYADTLTPAHLIAKLEELAQSDPLSWSVPALLRRLVDNGSIFADLNTEKG